MMDTPGKIGIRPAFLAMGVLMLAEGMGAFFSINTMFLRMAEIALFLGIVCVWGNGLSDIGLGRTRFYPGLRRGLLWSLGFGVLVGVGFCIIFFFGTNPFKLVHASLPRAPGRLIYFLVLAGIIGPVAEEIFFRGILYGFLRRLGVFTALFGSTLIFALLHSNQIPITQIIGGVLFAVAYEIEDNLMVPITIHVLGNMAIFMISMRSI